MGFPEDQMYEVVSIEPRSGEGAYGPVFGAAYEETWYLEPGFKAITDAQGQEVVASLSGIGPADSQLAILDEVVWNDQRYRAIAVDPVRFEGAAHHVEASFGSVER